MPNLCSAIPCNVTIACLELFPKLSGCYLWIICIKLHIIIPVQVDLFTGLFVRYQFVYEGSSHHEIPDDWFVDLLQLFENSITMTLHFSSLILFKLNEGVGLTSDNLKLVVVCLIILSWKKIRLEYKEDGLTTCSKTCGTGPLWLVQIPKVTRLHRQTDRQIRLSASLARLGTHM